LNKNKKGFSLVELLCAVAIIALMTPILVNGFIHAAKLNHRSRLQQRVDEAANYIYEGVSSVEYEDLADYLSDLNGWAPVEGSSGYEYHVTKPYDGLDDCTVTVAVKKYSSAYIVPDLNLVGEDSQYLTLSDVIYVDDNFANQRMLQEIKNSSSIKDAIVSELSGKGLTNIDKNKITISFPTDAPFNSAKVSKTTKLDLNIDNVNGETDVIVADYDVTYRYPAATCDDMSSTFSVLYKYSYKEDGKWKSSDGRIDGLSQVFMNAKKGTVYKPAEFDESVNEPQNVFVYYTPYSSLDYIDIKNKDSIPFNVFLIEQSETTDSGIRLSSYKHSGEEYDEVNGCYIFSRNDAEANGIINLFTNNTHICEDGIPDEIYQSGAHQENMYRIKVSVEYKSQYFSDVSGNFKTGEEILS
jgi:prepilin-type N-terminal cleavage/methylation domain-containing protein